MKGDECLYYKGRIYVPGDEELKKNTLKEEHSSFHAMHTGSTKMYQDLKTHYWRLRMMKEIGHFVTRCLACQQVKAEHQVPSGLLQPISIP